MARRFAFLGSSKLRSSSPQALINGIPSDIVRPLDGVGMAYVLFAHGEMWQAVDRLRLVEVDGASPGNDYRGMQLKSSVADANAAATALGLPIRFEGDAR